jgi:pSer/pThr/pTyr-binding forkhead associated (FHA) protein
MSKHAPEEAPIAEMHATVDQEFDIVLTPLSHPELGDIRIDENLFAIGRTEPPFASYPADTVADLSRRHARIFSQYGAAYIADLDSKNGTTVNGVSVRQKTTRLHHGDEICFGRVLSYRVQLSAHAQKAKRAAKLVSLTLTPERSDLGLQPIVLTDFPFLISKADAAFARYKDEYPHQVNYLSRRHAHIFLKNGVPFVEDLGSTNGTFVAGKRLEEHAVPLADGDLLAFGGHHFVYQVSLQKEEEKKLTEVDSTVTKLSSAVRHPVADSGDADKTTFIASANSFLDIFCVDQQAQQDDEVNNNEDLKQSGDGRKDTDKRQARGKFATFLSELNTAFTGNERKNIRRTVWLGTALAAVLAMAAFVLYLDGAPERELKDLVARGEYAQAVTVANQYLERYPDNPKVQTLGTEALLKANVPKWLATLRAREFDRAAAGLNDMKQLGSRNPDVQSLVNELEWIGNLEQFVMRRGGMDAPIRIYADEERIKILLKRWDEDTMGHQRALARIASYVPEFKDPYAEALSHLRRLQSDDSVYLAAIERLKTTISTELNRDQPQALEVVLKEYSEKYPRLGGLDNLRQDLRQYIEIDNEARARRLGPLVALLARVRFSTPPFQEKFRTLTASGRLPSADAVHQYEAVSKAWREGQTEQAVAGLQKMANGPWADVASSQLAHKKTVMDQFAQLQKARGAKGYDERLLAFYGSLDPDEDVYFIRATEADVGIYRDKALKHGQELLTKAQALWRRYRENGPIGGGQRLEAGISDQFRTQARLLSEARDDAQQGMRIYAQLKAERPAQWSKVQDEVNAEAELQRRALLELSRVLEPGLLKAKLALLGGGGNDERQPSKIVN